MAVINRTHAPDSSLNGNFRIEEEKKLKALKNCTTDEGLTISSGDLFYHGTLQNKSWQRASVQSCCLSQGNGFSPLEDPLWLHLRAWFFWIPPCTSEGTIWGAKYARGFALELAL